MAKFYYEQYPASSSSLSNTMMMMNNKKKSNDAKRLKLNQIVEILGVMEDDDDDDVDMEQQQQVGSRMMMLGNNRNGWDNTDALLFGENDDERNGGSSSSMTLSNHHHRSRHVPRLHVVWFRVVSMDDMDEIDNDEIGNASGSGSIPKPPSWMMQQQQQQQQQPSRAVDVLSRALLGTDMTSNNSSSSSSNNNAAVVAHAVWMLLQSKAERDADGNIAAVHCYSALQQQDTAVLGCASLNVILSRDDDDVHDEHSTATTTAAADFVDRLVRTLQQLVPVVQVLQVAASTTTTTTAMSENANRNTNSNHGNPDNSSDLMASASAAAAAVLPPRKVAGRLQQTALQLPAGSVLILDVRNQQQQQQHVPNSNHHWASSSSLQTCRDLCRQHRINYIFDGGMSIPFEADYRIIVLSSRSTSKLLPCTMTVQWSCNNNDSIGTMLSSNAAVADGMLTSSSALLPALREDLRQCRRTNSNIGIDRAVLTVAQGDFLKRRSVSREHAGEADFHRWLTLCRLHARSRRVAVADAFDWTSALALDDAMRATLSLLL